MQVEALRIIPDKLWYAAQIRLSNERNRGGRPPKDGERKSRPKLLNGLFVCPTHDHNLYVGGPNGRSMFCSHCQRLPAEERPLFTLLNRRLALDRTCAVLADLVRDDHDLVDAVIAACRQEAEALQRQDPEELQRLHRELEKLTKAIDFTSRNPGDSESDQVESAKRLRDLRRQREGLAAKIAELEAAGADLIRIPTEEEVRTLIRNLNLTLVLAANGGTDEEMAITRQIIETMIDGKIQLVQMGQRKAQRGWLQGRAHVRLVSFLASRAGGRLPRGMDETREVRIDYKWPRKFDQDVERAWQLYKQDKLCREIADVLGCSRSYVTKLLKAGAAQNGEQLLDGRTRRGKLEAKNVIFPRYIQIADAVRELDGQKLLLGEIANRLGVNIAIVKKALAFLSSSDGVAALDGRTRRKGLDQKTRKSKDDQPSKGEQGMRVA